MKQMNVSKDDKKESYNTDGGYKASAWSKKG